MKGKFEYIIIYEDKYGFEKPYSNIEFVISKNLIKEFITAVQVDSNTESYTYSKYRNGRSVLKPQNYEQFKRYLRETAIDKTIGDVRVVYAPVKNWNREKPYDDLQELGSDGYDVLLALAKEMLYEGESTDEKTIAHKKRTFVNESNKIHRERIAEFKEKTSGKQKQ